MQQQCRAAGSSQANLEREMWICMWDWLMQCPVAKVASGLASLSDDPFDPRRPHLFAGCLCIDPVSCHYTVVLLQGLRWLSVVWTEHRKDILCCPSDLWKISLLTNLSMLTCWCSKGSRRSWTAVSSSRLRLTWNLPQSLRNHLHVVCVPPPTPPLRAVAKRLH